MITHLREKIYHIDNANYAIEEDINELDEKLMRMRSLISTTRQNHEDILVEKQDIETRQQFANSELLLKDYENRIQYNVELQEKLNNIKAKYMIMKEKVEVKKTLKGTKSSTVSRTDGLKTLSVMASSGSFLPKLVTRSPFKKTI
jgi:hypothetical protein